MVFGGLKEATEFFAAADVSVFIERAPGAGWIVVAFGSGTGLPSATPG